MVGKFKFDYGMKLEPDQQAKLEAIVGKPIKIREEDGIVEPWEHYEGPVVDVMEVLVEGQHITIEGLGDPRPLVDMRDQVLEAFGRLERYVLAAIPEEGYLNTRVGVHVPGMGLLLMDDLQLEEDACTDHVQELLSEGWRIIAVCPQPDQRRPDYILGRQKLRED